MAGDASGAYCVGFRLGVAVSLPAITAPFEHEEFDGLVWTRRRRQVMQQTRETACAGLFAVGVVVLDGASMREHAEFRAVGMPEIVQQGEGPLLTVPCPERFRGVPVSRAGSVYEGVSHVGTLIGLDDDRCHDVEPGPAIVDVIGLVEVGDGPASIQTVGTGNDVTHTHHRHRPFLAGVLRDQASDDVRQFRDRRAAVLQRPGSSADMAI